MILAEHTECHVSYLMILADLMIHCVFAFKCRVSDSPSSRCCTYLIMILSVNLNIVGCCLSLFYRIPKFVTGTIFCQWSAVLWCSFVVLKLGIDVNPAVNNSLNYKRAVWLHSEFLRYVDIIDSRWQNIGSSTALHSSGSNGQILIVLALISRQHWYIEEDTIIFARLQDTQEPIILQRQLLTWGLFGCRS